MEPSALSELKPWARRASLAALARRPRSLKPPSHAVALIGPDLEAALAANGIRVELNDPDDADQRWFGVGGGRGTQRLWLLIGEKTVGQATTTSEPGDVAAIGTSASLTRGQTCSVVLQTPAGGTLRLEVPDPWLERDIRFIIDDSPERT